MNIVNTIRNYLRTFNPASGFTYTGAFTVISDGGRDWRVKFTTSGTLTFLRNPWLIDLFLVGGGGGAPYIGGGGGGGYTATRKLIAPVVGTAYPIVVGAGGTASTATGGARAGTGGSSTAFGETAAGGQGGAHIDNSQDGGNGGSGGGGTDGGYGGQNGEDGTGTTPGTGQGATTREFGEYPNTMYANGGRGYPYTGATGTANTGNGAGAGNSSGRTGGSGIVVIRRHIA